MGNNFRQTRSSDEDCLSEEMAVRASHGDISAFEALYERYNDYVKETALQVLHSHQDAEDVAQTVWSKLLVKLHQYIPSARFSTWLYSVATHAAIDHRRRLNRKREIPLESIEETVCEKKYHTFLSLGASLPDQELAFLVKRIYEELDTALGGLQNRNKIRCLCFQLHYFYDMSVKEIAAEMHIAEGTVKSHLYLARKYLEEKHPVLSELYFALQEKSEKAS
jgi:RNA polymerase sigma-70 factor, ECF subfamily